MLIIDMSSVWRTPPGSLRTRPPRPAWSRSRTLRSNAGALARGALLHGHHMQRSRTVGLRGGEGPRAARGVRRAVGELRRALAAAGAELRGSSGKTRGGASTARVSRATVVRVPRAGTVAAALNVHAERHEPRVRARDKQQHATAEGAAHGRRRRTLSPTALDRQARVLGERLLDMPPPQRLRTRRLDERAAAAAQREEVLRVERRGDEQLQIQRQIANGPRKR